MDCRVGCGACCIAPSITSPLPGMPNGKPAGVRCVNLSDDYRCRIWGTPEYPSVCAEFRPTLEECGHDRPEALVLLARLEELTRPDA